MEAALIVSILLYLLSAAGYLAYFFLQKKYLHQAGFIVLVGGFIGYSTTDLPGANEVRKFFSPVVRLVRKEAAQQLPKLREKTRQAVDKAVDILADDAEPAKAG